MKVSKSTIIRTFLLIISLINIVINIFGYKTIPVENETLEELISSLVLIIAAISSWWKNNSFTQEALMADEYLDELREKR